jgi:AcrR family transcriptional regulator
MARAPDPALRQRILDAAARVFEEKGFAATRMSDIAAAADVAVGSIYLHFKTKETLCGALTEGFNSRVLAESLPLLANADPAQGLADAVRAALRIFEQERALLGTLYLSIGFAPFVADGQMAVSDSDTAVFEAFGAQIQAHMDAGHYRRYNVLTAVHLITNLLEHTAVGYLLLGAGDLRAAEDDIVRFIQCAMLTHPPAQPKLA